MLTGCLLLFVLGAAMVIRKIARQDTSGQPSRAQLDVAIAPFVKAMGLARPRYSQRGSLISMSTDRGPSIPSDSFMHLAAGLGWSYTGSNKGPYFHEYLFCKERLSLLLEKGNESQPYTVVAVRWTSDLDSPAYCK